MAISNDNFIKVDREWFEGARYYNRYGDHGLLMYSMILQEITIREYCNFNMSDIVNKLGYTFKNNNKQINILRQSVIDMAKDEYIEIYDLKNRVVNYDEIINNKNYRIYITVKVPWVPLYDECFDKIIISKFRKGISKFRVLSMYGYILCECNKQYSTATITVNDFKDTIHIGDSSVNSYGKILEESKLINYCSSGFNKENKKENPNVYSTHDDLPTLKKYMLDNHLTTYDNLKLQKKERDLKRSVKLINTNKLSEVK